MGKEREGELICHQHLLNYLKVSHDAGALPSPLAYLQLPDLLPCKISNHWQDAVSGNQIWTE